MDTYRILNEDYSSAGILSKFPEETAVTMAYVPFQQDRRTYSLEEALENGTAFPTLNKPFLGGCHG